MEKIIRSSKARLLYLMAAAVMVSAILLLCAGTGILHSGNATRQVLLTFDDGPDPRYTPQILAILKEHNIRALFFVVGSKAEEHGDILKQIVLEGHSIGSHGYSHENIDTLTPEQLREEVRLTDAAVLKATGLSPGLIRPPRGRYNRENSSLLRQAGKEIMLWSAGLEKESLHDPAAMVEFLLQRIKGKEKLVLLLHDGDLTGHARNTTVEALPLLITELRQQGYTFVDPASEAGKKFIVDYGR